jgi:ankyrin repeat protein
MTELHVVSKRGDLDALRHLLQASKALVDEEDLYNQTPLFRAAITGSVECVRALLDAGANINHRYFVFDVVSSQFSSSSHHVLISY